MMTSNDITATAVNERVSNMATWAKDVDEKLKSVSALIAGLLAIDDTEQTQLIRDMTDLEKRLIENPSIKRTVTLELIDLRQTITDAEGSLDDIEANLYLNICAELKDDNKLVYTNEPQRKMALKVAKGHSAEYEIALTELHLLEAERARIDAHMTELCEHIKADRSIYAGFVARLENFTARITLNRKEN